jgi:hypothetical protein
MTRSESGFRIVTRTFNEVAHEGLHVADVLTRRCAVAAANAIYDLTSACSAPPRGRLRYLDRESGQWVVFDRFDIKHDHDDPNGLPRALGCFVASAAIHHASETGCDG